MSWIDEALHDDRPDSLRWHMAFGLRMLSYAAKGVALLFAILLPITLLAVLLGGEPGIPVAIRIGGWIAGTAGLAALLSPAGMMYFMHRDIERARKRLEPDAYLRAYDKAMS